jgi:hypothetical protein
MQPRLPIDTPQYIHPFLTKNAKIMNKIINIIKPYIPKTITQRDWWIGSLMLFLITIIGFAGKRQIDKRRINKGKTEYKRGNWRLSYRILYDYRHHWAFDKEACQMLGCIMRRGYGDIYEWDEDSTFWFAKAGVKDCEK